MEEEEGETAADKNNENVQETDPNLVLWECFSLSAEEHTHAMQLFLKNKTGKPLGHR